MIAKISTVRPVLLLATWVRSTRVFWLLLLLMAALFAPVVDGYFRPAVRDFSVDMAESYFTSGAYADADGISHKTDVAVIYGNMNKQRCKFVAINGIGYSNTRGEVPIGINFQDRAAGDQTKNRPTGVQRFGPWMLSMKPPADVWGVQLSAAHLCGVWPMQWTIYTNLGPVISVDTL